MPKGVCVVRGVWHTGPAQHSSQTPPHIKAASPILNPNPLPEGQEGFLSLTAVGGGCKVPPACPVGPCGGELCLCAHSKLRLSVQLLIRVPYTGHVPIWRQPEVTSLAVQSLHGQFLSITTSWHQLQGYEMVTLSPGIRVSTPMSSILWFWKINFHLKLQLKSGVLLEQEANAMCFKITNEQETAQCLRKAGLKLRNLLNIALVPDTNSESTYVGMCVFVYPSLNNSSKNAS